MKNLPRSFMVGFLVVAAEARLGAALAAVVGVSAAGQGVAQAGTQAAPP